MGWTFYNRPPADPRAELRRLCTWEDANGTRQVLADAMKGGTWYAAVEHVRPDGSREVWAAVFLTSRRDGWGYKDMCESMGPVESDCPARVLDLLTPLADDARGYAAEWRARCRANLAKPKAPPLRDGATVKLAASFNLPGGPCDTFTARRVVRRGRNVWRFIGPHGDGPYNVAGYTKVIVSVA